MRVWRPLSQLSNGGSMVGYLACELADRIAAFAPVEGVFFQIPGGCHPDHPAANRISLDARVYAQAEGYPLPGPALGAPPVFMFEPHQPEQCNFRPEVLLDVTEVWDKKRRAMESMEAQAHLVDYYSDLSRRRGTQAVRNSGKKGITHAEAYQRVFPQVTDAFA